jgi:hypothetical protein
MLGELNVDQQKRLLADTFASSVMPLLDKVLRKRCEQWVEEIYNALQEKKA